jgi:hypothetical protein
VKRDNTTETFFTLVKAGLWDQEVRLSEYEHIDLSEIYRLAEEQSVVGLVAAGFEHVVDVKLPKEDVLQFVGQALQLEQQNQVMNAFIGKLVDKLRAAGIYALLVKGQGIAQCYEKPLWRSCGDVDLLFDEDNYEKAKVLLPSFASTINPENPYTKHVGMTIGQWVVELHGNMRSNILERIDDMIDSVQEDTFINNRKRIWNNGNTDVYLPSPDNDVIFVFTHILHHFYRSGVGLRQICDWNRLLYTFRDDINLDSLEKRLSSAGIMLEWRRFGHFSVEYLGMPKEAMPFYSTPSLTDKKKSEMILSFVMKTGNFGHNRDRSYYIKYPYLIRKCISFWRYGGDILHHCFLFPNTSFRFFIRFVFNGFAVVIRGE